MQVNTTHTVDGRPFYRQVFFLAVDNLSSISIINDPLCKQVGGEGNYIYSFCSQRTRIDVQCPRFHIGPVLGSVSAGMYRIGAPGYAATSMDPSEWGEYSSIPWSEFSGRSSDWLTGKVLSLIN
jgi:hypothetical protein